ncbi:MAG: glycosyltransferase family 4 protein [Pseudomonadota bacterium]
MRDIAFAVPGDLNTPTGGYRYDRAVIAELRRLGHKVDHIELGAGFPFPSDEEISDAAARLKTVPPAAVLMVDGLALGAMPAGVLEAVPATLVGLVHHPLALETGLDGAVAAQLRTSERDALATVNAVVVTSPHTAEILKDQFAVSKASITIALPGLSDRWQQVKNAPIEPPLIVSVGSISPRKGFDVLVVALGLVSDLAWTCDIIGAMDRNTPTAIALAENIAALGLSERIRLRGALEEAAIAERYRDATLFALATHYEGFGMVFAEAMAAGLPIVGTTGGAVPGVVPPEAGVLVPPGDAQSFAAALRDLLTDIPRRGACAVAARNAGVRFGGWEETARTISGVIEKF